jgi:hypothetical protein
VWYCDATNFYHEVGGGAPLGPASGDLGGSYPNPSVSLLTHTTNAAIPVAVSAPSLTLNTNGTSELFSTFKPTSTYGANIFIGGGGQSSAYDGTNNYTGSFNVSLGDSSLVFNTTGYQNLAFGYGGLYFNTTGYYNVAIGTYGLFSNTTGVNNVAIGPNSGYNSGVPLQTLSFDTFIGFGANASTDGLSNSTAVGNAAQITGNNQVVLGNGSVTDVYAGGANAAANVHAAAVSAPSVNAQRYADGAPSSCTTTSGGSLTTQADCAFFQAVDAATTSGNSVDLTFGDGYYLVSKPWVEPTAGFYNVNLKGASQNGTILIGSSSHPTSPMLTKTAGSAYISIRDLTFSTNDNFGSCMDLTGGVDGGTIENVQCNATEATATSGLDHAMQFGSSGSYAEDLVIENLGIAPPYGQVTAYAQMVGTGTTSLTGATISAGGTYPTPASAVGIVNDPNHHCTGDEPTFTPVFTGSAVTSVTVTNAGTCSGGLPDLQVIEQLAVAYGLKAYVSDSKIDYFEPLCCVTGGIFYGGNDTFGHAHPTDLQYGLFLDFSVPASSYLSGTELDTISTAGIQIANAGGGVSIVGTQPYVVQGLPGSAVFQFMSGAANINFGPQSAMCPGYGTPIDYHEFLGTLGPTTPGSSHWPSGSTILGNDQSCTSMGSGSNVDYDPNLFTPPAYLYYGYGCAGTASNTCTIGGSSQGSVSGSTVVPAAIRTGADPSGYTVAAMGAYFAAAAGNVTFAIYSGSPTLGTLVCSASAEVPLTLADAWTENNNFSGCTLAASTTYYLALQQSSDGSEIAYDTATGYYFASTYGTWPSTQTLTSSGNDYSVYVRVAPN